LDHRWGLNLYRRGLGDLGATMAARWHAPIPTDVVYLLNVPGFFIWGVQVHPDEDHPFVMLNMGTNPTGMHFPYGRDVVPD
jgi:hypothetical protein